MNASAGGVLLQMCPFSAPMEQGLAARFDVVRWFEMDTEARQRWLAAHAGEVRAVATSGHVGISPALMQQLPRLGIVAINGVGVDKVDLPLAASRGIHVTTTPGALAEDVADLAVGLVISLLRGIPGADAFVRAGRWPQGEWPLARRVSGRHFGIVGLGQIGSAIARRLAAFGRVSYHGPRAKPVPHDYQPDLLQLARDADVLVVACPASPATQRMIGRAHLDALGPEGALVNIARGAIVDEPALIEALEQGRLGGAALDVFEHEPQVPEALRASPRVVLTPHIASGTAEARRHMAEIVFANLDAFLEGRAPPHAREPETAR